MTAEDHLYQALAFISRFNRLEGQPGFASELNFWLEGKRYDPNDEKIIKDLIIIGKQQEQGEHLWPMGGPVFQHSQD